MRVYRGLDGRRKVDDSGRVADVIQTVYSQGRWEEEGDIVFMRARNGSRTDGLSLKLTPGLDPDTIHVEIVVYPGGEWEDVEYWAGYLKALGHDMQMIFVIDRPKTAPAQNVFARVGFEPLGSVIASAVPAGASSYTLAKNEIPPKG